MRENRNSNADDAEDAKRYRRIREEYPLLNSTGVLSILHSIKASASMLKTNEPNEGAQESPFKSGNDKTFRLQTKPAGRKPDPLYDECYQKIRAGEPREDVFIYWCNIAEIKLDKKYALNNKPYRDRFKKAMKRRERKAENKSGRT